MQEHVNHIDWPSAYARDHFTRLIIKKIRGYIKFLMRVYIGQSVH